MTGADLLEWPADGNGGVFVDLEPHELGLAIIVGAVRNLVAVGMGRRHAHRLARAAPGWNLHMSGAAGELAVAKYRRAYWAGSLGVLDTAPADAAILFERAAHGAWLFMTIPARHASPAKPSWPAFRRCRRTVIMPVWLKRMPALLASVPSPTRMAPLRSASSTVRKNSLQIVCLDHSC